MTAAIVLAIQAVRDEAGSPFVWMDWQATAYLQMVCAVLCVSATVTWGNKPVFVSAD